MNNARCIISYCSEITFKTEKFCEYHLKRRKNLFCEKCPFFTCYETEQNDENLCVIHCKNKKHSHCVLTCLNLKENKSDRCVKHCVTPNHSHCTSSDCDTLGVDAFCEIHCDSENHSHCKISGCDKNRSSDSYFCDLHFVHSGYKSYSLNSFKRLHSYILHQKAKSKSLAN